MAIPIPKQLLFNALVSGVSVYSDAGCGLTCGQRALLDQVRITAVACSEGLFSMFGVWGILPLRSLMGKFRISGISNFIMQ